LKGNDEIDKSGCGPDENDPPSYCIDLATPGADVEVPLSSKKQCNAYF
jgi:hypothetical protein